MIQDAIKDTIGLLTGSAFRSPADNTKSPIASRFKGRKVAVLSYGSNFIKFGSVSFKKGKIPVIENVQLVSAQINRGAITESLLAPLKTLTDCKSVIVLVGDRVSYTYKSGLRQLGAVPELMTLANDPRPILGNDSDPALRYALIHHPTFPQSIEMTVERSELDMLYGVLSGMGLTVARVQSATGAVLSGLLTSKIFAAGGVAVVVDHSAATVVIFGEKGDWKKEFRHQDNICRAGGDHSRLDKLLSEVAPAQGLPFILVDTGTSELPDNFASAARRYTKDDGAPDGSPEFFFSAYEGEGTTLCKGLGHEFGRVPIGGETMPSWARMVPVAFYLGLAGLLGATGFQYLQAKRFETQQKALKARMPEMDRQKAEIRQQEAAGHELADQADVVGLWLERTVMLQPLMAKLAEAFDDRIRIATLTVSRSTKVPGSYQLNMTFSVDPKIFGKIEDDLTTKAAAAGWKLVPTQATPNSGLFNYEALLTPDTTDNQNPNSTTP